MALSDDQIADALRRTAGIVAAAAEKLGVTRQAISKRVTQSEELQAVRDDARETILDLSESALVEAIKDREGWAVRLMLTTQGKDRGYVTRQERTGKRGGPIETVVRSDHDPQGLRFDALFEHAEDGELEVLETEQEKDKNGLLLTEIKFKEIHGFRISFL